MSTARLNLGALQAQPYQPIPVPYGSWEDVYRQQWRWGAMWSRMLPANVNGRKTR